MPDEKVYDQREAIFETGQWGKDDVCRSGVDPVSREIALTRAGLVATVNDETEKMQTRIGELERDLRHHSTLERNYKIREADQLLLIAYHHSKAGAELAARLNRVIGYMPEDERDRARKLVDGMVASFAIADTLIADSGNGTPHEKG